MSGLASAEGKLVDTTVDSFSEHARRLHPRIEEALRAQCRLGPGCPAVLQEAMAYSLLAPGKRLRPMLVLLAAEACGGRLEEALPAACAVEMVHAFSLVHDDLPAMDDDDLRRGRPTCHKKYGEAIAILAGDALLALAFEVLAKQVRPPEVAAACCAALAEAAGPAQLAGGQADDILSCATAADEQTLQAIHERKTGAMIRVSLKLGGLIAGAGAEQLAALERFGSRLGLAFQITDDLLDVCGSEATLGKRVGKDAEQGKLTFPGLLGIKESMARAERLVGEAEEVLAPLGASGAPLRALARYVLERKR